MTSQFTWIPFYRELANVLSDWQERQSELISFLENLRKEKNYVITKLMDKNEDGANFLLTEIDPFTFFGVFNRGIRDEQRIAILQEIKNFFDLQSTLPSDFTGIPILNNMNSWFFAYKRDREADDIKKLWRVFKSALQNDPLNNDDFINAFDDALTVKQTNVNLTMGLFWIRPETFINLDQKNRTYLKIKLPSKGLSAKFYIDTLKKISERGKPFPQLSHQAFVESVGSSEEVELDESEKVNYWLVGAYWDSSDPPDQTDRFVADGIWINGYHDRYLEEVKSMQVGDKIAIKASMTQKRGLPFDGRNKTVSRMDIKAIGTVVANRGDGRTVEVEWNPDFKEKSWYFYTGRSTVWHVKSPNKNVLTEAAGQLINFVWYGYDQDYDWFIHKWWDSDEVGETIDESENEVTSPKSMPYSIDDIVASGVFLEIDEVNQIIDRLNEKKAMIIQGPPGVGKTFVARKLAYALMKEIDDKRLEFVQFHQSYSYDDFVRGYRPLPGKAGSFGLKNGVFFEFCQKSINDPDHDYVFIIDEINRGNLSQIFGELLMLIEHDKRGSQYAVPLVYQADYEPRFYIPSNLYLIGLMNLADRSLAMVDYALRRRFAFVTLEPKYESDIFKKWLADRSMKQELIELIVSKISTLNRIIREDPLLGENYQIGHSYFCPKGEHFDALDENWYRSIVKTEIIPLIKEYWFDNMRKAEEAGKNLLNY